MLKGQIARLLIEQGRAQAPLGSSLPKFSCISQDNIYFLKKDEIVYLHFIRFFFLMWSIFLKPLLNLLQYCFCFFVLFFWPQCMWDLNSLTRDRTLNS